MKLAVVLLTAIAARSALGRVVEEPPLAEGWNNFETTFEGSSTDYYNSSEWKDPEVVLRVQLVERNQRLVAETALAVSSPGNPLYGAFLSRQDVEKLVAPDATAASSVVDWLESWGVVRVEKDGVSSLVVRGSREAVEAGLKTQLRVVSNGEQTALRASDYKIPTSVEDAVSTIFGLHGLPLPLREARLSAIPVPVTPAVLASTYGIKGVNISAGKINRQAVAEFQGQTMNHTDLVLFFEKYVDDYVKGRDDTVATFVGDPGDKRAEVEASLDIQYIMGVAPGVRTSFYLYDPMDFCADLKNWTTTLLKQDEPEWVHSVSYGWQGPVAQLGCSAEAFDAVDNDFAKLAARGVSIIFASGDSGSGYSAGGLLYPSWPASSPFVTAVGATRFVDQTMHATNDEMASDQFGSGGGFSRDFPQWPDAIWQKRVVRDYFKRADKAPPFPTEDLFPVDGRATPDVSALGEGYQVLYSGQTVSVGGTSASAPAFAGLVSLLNEARLGQKKKQLGFLNPWLYQVEDCFSDVVLGSNAIGRGSEKLKYGFNTSKGWDPATGLGTPNFQKLLKSALDL